MVRGPYLPKFISVVTYKCAQKAKVFFTGKSFQPIVMQRSSLLGPFKII